MLETRSFCSFSPPPLITDNLFGIQAGEPQQTDRQYGQMMGACRYVVDNEATNYPAGYVKPCYIDEYFVMII